jgi:hypothetical protein
MHDDPHRYRIVPLGSGPVGWAIERDGKMCAPDRALRCRAPGSMRFSRGASSREADGIAKVIERRPRPNYEERG